MMVAGAYVTCSGGGAPSADWRRTPSGWCRAELRVGVADTVDEVRRAVRRILNGGADLIKLIATGAVMSAAGTPASPS